MFRDLPVPKDAAELAKMMAIGNATLFLIWTHWPIFREIFGMEEQR